jgi:hypothetical protein
MKDFILALTLLNESGCVCLKSDLSMGEYETWDDITKKQEQARFIYLAKPKYGAAVHIEQPGSFERNCNQFLGLRLNNCVNLVEYLA